MTDISLPIIKPMTLAELLDRAIRLYRQNFVKFVGIFAIPYIPLMLIQTGLAIFSTTSMLNQTNTNSSAFPFTLASMAALSGTFLVAIVQFILVQGLATAALTSSIANNYAGKPIGILDSYRSMSTTWLKLLLALFLVFLLTIILFIWMIIPCVGWFSGPGILFFIALAVSPLIPPIIVLEKMDAAYSIRRAWDLARSRFWWLIGCVFVLALLGWLLVAGPVYLMSAILQFVLTSIPGTVVQHTIIATILQNLITITMSLLYTPLKLTVMTLVYFDLRARSEGLDLAMQMPGASNSDSSENAVINLPEITTKTSTPLITGIDIGRFALLSLAGILFYAIIVGIVSLFTLALM